MEQLEIDLLKTALQTLDKYGHKLTCTQTIGGNGISDPINKYIEVKVFLPKEIFYGQA